VRAGYANDASLAEAVVPAKARIKPLDREDVDSRSGDAPRSPSG